MKHHIKPDQSQTHCRNHATNSARWKNLGFKVIKLVLGQTFKFQQQ